VKEVCNTDNITDLMVNSYGNYVVQKALKLSSKNDKIVLINNIYKNMQKIKDKKLIQKWKTIIESNLEGTLDDYDTMNSIKNLSISGNLCSNNSYTYGNISPRKNFNFSPQK